VDSISLEIPFEAGTSRKDWKVLQLLVYDKLCLPPAARAFPSTHRNDDDGLSAFSCIACPTFGDLHRALINIGAISMGEALAYFPSSG
jgi:hypothetical protein